MKTKLFSLCAAILLFACMAVPASAAEFTDVPADAWYHDAVDAVSDEGLMSGTSVSTFAPDTLMNRGMLVTVLYRMEGTPDISESSSFSDVSADAYYSNAVAWAAQANIVTGTGNGHFEPNTPISRQQLAAILYRYAQYKNYTTTAIGDLSAFTDTDQISSYAAEPLRWATTHQILNGDGDRILPTNPATRAQTAAMLVRFQTNIANQTETPENSADSENSVQPTEQRRMKITVGTEVIYATLADNATADAIAERLPLTLNLMDLYGREMCYRFDDEMPADEVQTRNFELGEIIYWPPRHSFVIMYHQDGEQFSMQHVGQLEDVNDVQLFGQGDVNVTFELDEAK